MNANEIARSPKLWSDSLCNFISFIGWVRRVVKHESRNGSGLVKINPTHFHIDYCCGVLGKRLCLRFAIPISCATSYLNFSNSGVSWTIVLLGSVKAYTSLEYFEKAADLLRCCFAFTLTLQSGFIIRSFVHNHTRQFLPKV